MTIKEVAEKYDISADTLRYYERVGMIPKVTRKANGIRDYQESDLGWVELALCMRSAGLPVEVMIEYVKLYKEGDNTIPARQELLQEQMNSLKEQRNRLKVRWRDWLIRYLSMKKLWRQGFWFGMKEGIVMLKLK